MTPAIATDFPHEIQQHAAWIPLADGTRLYAWIWRPEGGANVPALLEYLPYRLGDWTAPRDAERHPWYAGHGYASIRVDVRGHGNSDGFPGDEYSEQELADGVEVVNWIARQPWCTGKVGMFGISWGGFNSLQIAALAPEPLKAIVTVCSTDDRYDNDVHYMGGSVLAVDMHAWASTMLAFASRPPDPTVVGEDWRTKWLARLDRLDPLINTWLDHQTRDDYWRRGSVCEDYSAISAAVLAVGGWSDPYRDTVLRLVANADQLGNGARGIIGPWSHQYPDRGLPPGPSIDFLSESLRWWDYWLKDEPNGVLEEPLLRTWISESDRPATTYERREGRWVAEPSWPSTDVRMSEQRLRGAPVLVHSPQQTGIDAGRFFPFGNDADLPPDQREEDGRSQVFDSLPLPERVEILGRPMLRLRISTEAAGGQVIARICDVAPDGSSTLVTRGVLNLSARHGRDKSVPWEPGTSEDIEFELKGIGWAVPAGHRIRLAVSSSYWPWIWPQPEDSGFTIDAERSSYLLPVRTPAEPGSARADADAAVVFGQPQHAEHLAVRFPDAAETGVPARPERLVTRDVGAGTWTLDVDPGYGGTRIYPDGLTFTEDAEESYTITEGDPLSARTHSAWSVRLERPDIGWDAGLRTRSEITCDADNFYTENEVICTDGGVEIFARTWNRTIARTAG